MADGQVVFEISGDNRKVKDTLRDTTSAIEREGKNWDKAASNAGDSIQDKFTKVFKAIAASAVAAKVGKALLDFGADAIQAASDLEEVQNVVDVTFGDGAAKIESWAKAAGTQFGLTETQAKRFTSTLGAMMKSAGLAGPEIVDMSTDLAGLAADMASFYNLDFDTAFQKIRSGISGETEPLRQLGINMSVANLEAYALTQGITTAFDQMSQGEQTMLRYQYLMQATADAQGDFARTSDGYANSVRQLQTNIETLKTNVGGILLPIVNDVVAGINGMVSALTVTPPRTVLDDFADIDLKTAEKLADIESTAEEATLLAAQLEELAASVDSLNPTVDTSKWETLLTALTSGGNIDLSGAGKSVKDFAKALNGSDPGTDRAKAWQELLGALSADVEGLSKLTGMSAEDTAAWLEKLAEGANTLDPNSAEGWDKLFTQLVAGLPGLEGTEFAELFSQIAGDAGNAEGNLEALGYSTDEIADKQAAWLEVCRRLVKTIPGLSSIINTETGEVKGGTEAVREYIKAWQEGQTKLAMMNALQQKESALSERFSDLPGLQLDAALAERRVRQNREKMDAILKKYGFSGERPYNLNSVMASEYGISKEDFDAYNELARTEVALEDEAEAATSAYRTQKDALDEAQVALEEYRETIDEMPGEIDGVAGATGKLASEMTELEKAADGDETAMTNLKNSLDTATKALQAVDDYYNKIHESSYSGLKSVAGGFEAIETPAQKARKQMRDLSEDLKNLSDAEIDIKLAEGGDIPTIQNMTKALESQLQYLNEYNDLIAKARERGVSDTVLASLADGSVESYDYLSALTQGSDEEIQSLNDRYQEVEEARQSLADTLADTQLAADAEFQSLVDAAQAAAEDLDQYTTAESSMANTVQGIADGIAEKIPDVQTQVDALNAVLGNLGNVGGLVGGLFGGGFHLDGSHATGLDYVPFDNYLAQLHEGESILTAEEARVWRQFKNGGARVANNIDYGALHGAIWDGAPKMGGDVYLDGRTVGRVISEQQGNSLRTLERSGWQK